jgi:pimeloyl-ACP methyl ester carboxylesterase
MLQVAERTIEIEELPYLVREAPSNGTPVLYLHGVPTSSRDWLPFLGRTGGIAPDLPGFGRSAKRGDLDYSIAGYDRFLELLLAQLGVERFSLVAHDWGAAGLALAQRRPERIERLVLIDAVPLLPGFHWHRLGRLWRTPGIGELTLGLVGRWSLRRFSRRANVTPGPLPDDMLDAMLTDLDPGTQRAILLLYRSAPVEALAAAGAHLDRIEAPSLVVWGARDPYLPVEFAGRYAQALPHAERWEVPDAGHWPWLDRPEIIDRVTSFLGGG